MERPEPLTFLTLTFAFSLPFWVLGTVADIQILPGLPSSALMVVAPALAASVLVLRTGGRSSLGQFLQRAVDARITKPWAWVVAIGAMPTVMVASGLWLIVTGSSLPDFQVDPAQMLILFVLFLIAAMAEELGWSGCAALPLYRVHGLLGASAIIGAAVVIWHVIPLLQIGRSWDWIVWWSLGVMARRLIIIWLYMFGGPCTLLAATFHAMSNLSWMMFPVMGSHYHPPSVAVILILTAAVPTIFLNAKARNHD